jgi:MinD-like ATPase involved in chromosome partitioning or flagellar assembly
MSQDIEPTHSKNQFKRLSPAVELYSSTPSRDTVPGLFYLVLCWILSNSNLEYKPNEPQDRHHRQLQKVWREICEIVASSKPFSCAVIGSKGGIGKTPLISMLSLVCAAASHKSTLAAEFHPDTGTMGDRLGVSTSQHGEYRTFHMVRHPEIMESHTAMSKLTATYPGSSLDVLLAEPKPDQPDNITCKEVFEALTDKLFSHYSNVFCDTGNGDLTPIHEGNLFAVDTCVFPVMADKDDNYKPSLMTMIQMHKAGHTRLVVSMPKVVNATNPKDSKDKYLAKYRDGARKILEDSGWRYERIMPDTDKPLPTRPKKTEQSSEEQLAEYREALVNRLLDDLGVTKDNIFLIPFSKHIANNGVASVERSKIGILALMAYSELLLHLMKLPAPTLEEKKARFEATMSQRGEDQMRRPTPVMDPATVDLNLQRLRDANAQGDGDGVKRTLAGIAEMLTKKPEAEAGMTEKE